MVKNRVGHLGFFQFLQIEPKKNFFSPKYLVAVSNLKKKNSFRGINQPYDNVVIQG